MHGMRVILIALLLTVPAAGGLRAAEHGQTAEIMAAYLYNFARFVEWPAGAFATPQSPLVLCSTHAAVLSGHLQRIGGREAQGRSIAIRVIGGGEDPAGCHVLFLSRQDALHTGDILAAVAGRPVLTVSDQPDFTLRGGMIGMFVARGRVQFAIARGAAEAAGLRVSSRLLALAQAAPGGRP